MPDATSYQQPKLLFQMKQLTVRSGKGDKDRFTTFPATLTPLLQNHNRAILRSMSFIPQHIAQI
jgi:hypothetical protein